MTYILPPLSSAVINAYLTRQAREAFKQIDVYKVISSTNDVAKENVNSLIKKNGICIAEQQTVGRGRLDRKWVSPYGCNLYLSLYQHLPLPSILYLR